MTSDSDQPTEGVRDTAQPAGTASTTAATVAMLATISELRRLAMKAAPALFSSVERRVA